MNILHLKYAAEIAKTGSLNKAAENLYMGQPNLSRAIKELEANLGITIFERSARGMTVTPEGEKFIGYANKILTQIDEVEAIYKNGTSVTQNFSISVPRASYISEAFVNFSKKTNQNAPFDLVYKETNAMRAIKNILEADYNLGIIRYAENYDSHFRQLLVQKGLVGELFGLAHLFASPVHSTTTAADNASCPGIRNCCSQNCITGPSHTALNNGIFNT